MGVRFSHWVPSMLYRICMVNTYKDTKAFLEYHEYGDKAQLKIWNMSESSGVTRKDVGEIIVFLNYREVGRYQAKREGLAKVQELIDNAPSGALRDFNEYRDMIFKSLL